MASIVWGVPNIPGRASILSSRSLAHSCTVIACPLEVVPSPGVEPSYRAYKAQLGAYTRLSEVVPPVGLEPTVSRLPREGLATWPRRREDGAPSRIETGTPRYEGGLGAYMGHFRRLTR